MAAIAASGVNGFDPEKGFRGERIVPELPDVETFKRYLDATGLHQEIKAVKVYNDRILRGISSRKLQSALKGKSFESTYRFGKHLFAQFDEKAWLELHFGMSGWLKYFKKMDKDPPHDRLLVSFTNGYHLAYDSQRMLGNVGLFEDPQELVDEKDLGPDALDIDLTAFRKALEGRRGSIKSALMNQEILAGIGNVYSDEILYQAGIHPRTKVDQLDSEDVKRLFHKMKRVLEMTVEKKANPEEFPKSYIIPVREDGADCPRCGGTVKSTKISGRTAYFCPKCQKEP